MSQWKNVNNSLIWLGLLLPLILYGINVFRRPSRVAIAPKPLFQGITYRRQVKQTPRPHIIHIVEIDLTAPGITPLVTLGYPGAVPGDSYNRIPEETLAQRTSEFVETQGVQLAINGNFFYPFREVTPWNYGPRPGKRVNSVGIIMSEGKLVSKPEEKWPSLCLMERRAEIRADGTCEDSLQAVAGQTVLLENGEQTEAVTQRLAEEGIRPYPFNIVALDATGTQLWLIQTDGKQPFYSEGITLPEATDLLQELGVETALRLDGGGSTTMAISTPDGPKVLNVPAHTKIPGRQRPVANNLGFFAKPLVP
ncbi:MAG: phosphodiester glycosidase family protein [Leptolyngbyaceae cyanobacterium MAG.088]|nr:phosphodiester glycosidase family protein [Leptolyngbyaceae cyanobacterium MAG.088]